MAIGLFDNLSKYAWPFYRRSPIAKSHDVIIHIGPPKTGTSAIQAFFHHNMKNLRRAGYFYPYHGLDANQVSGGHYQLGGKLREGKLEEARTLFNEWLSMAQKKGYCLLLSAESFIHHFVEFRDLTKGMKVKIIAYFRDPVQSLLSAYNQTVKRSFRTGSLEIYIAHQLKTDLASGWMKILSGKIFQDWSKAFGIENMKILLFHEALFPQKKIEYSILSALGIHHDAQKNFHLGKERINVGYTPGALELKRILNYILDKNDAKMCHDIDLKLQAYSDSIGTTSDIILSLLDKKVLEKIEEKFSESNMSVRRTFFQNYSDTFWNSVFLNRRSENEYKTVTLSSVFNSAFYSDKRLVEYLKRLAINKMTSMDNQKEDLALMAQFLGIKHQESGH